MTTDTWLNAQEGFWTTSSNWSDGVPTSTSDVVINISGIVVEAPGDIGTVNSISITGPSSSPGQPPTSLDILPGVSGQTGVSSVTGDITLNDSAAFNLIEGSIAENLSIGGNVSVSGSSTFEDR
jgi:hypothetical protein